MGGKMTPWTGYITATAGLNMRSGRSVLDPVVAVLGYGAIVTVYEKTEDWYKVSYQGVEGYVFAEYVSADDPNAEHGGNFEKAITFVLKHEGQLSLDKNDRGNWTGGEVGVGELRGTKYGISAASYKHLDIRNLTVEDAKELYRKDYWLPSKANTLTWDMAMIQLDSAAQHGVGAALRWLGETKEPLPYLAKRLRFYTNIETFSRYGVAWMKRLSDLMTEISR
jgi:hypothetical protein